MMTSNAAMPDPDQLLIELLRGAASELTEFGDSVTGELMLDAANRIEQLRCENERLSKRTTIIAPRQGVHTGPCGQESD